MKNLLEKVKGRIENAKRYRQAALQDARAWEKVEVELEGIKIDIEIKLRGVSDESK